MLGGGGEWSFLTWSDLFSLTEPVFPPIAELEMNNFLGKNTIFLTFQDQTFS